MNELHVPAGTPVELVMTSEDVIHSFYIPAFRTKADAVPGRYTSLWFQATKPGTYHLFCAEYCGTQHSGMIGSVIVMDPAAFQDWLGGGSGEGVSMAGAGQKLFGELGCATCHEDASPESPSRGPAHEGLYGSTVTLQGGDTVTADEDYLRESILDPNAKIVAGYPGIMPTFKGLVTEEQLLQLIEYIKSRPAAKAGDPAHPAGAAAAPAGEPATP
jgi:cytochrome c oxidase subunit 2